MASLQKFKDDFLLLCEAGFIAVNQADEDAATKLFNAAKLLNKENTLPIVGAGYMHLMKLEIKPAINCFNEVIAKEPDNEMAKTFLGITYAFTQSEVMKGEKLLEKMAKGSEDDLIKKLASAALTFIEQFVKKAPSPLDNPPQSKKEKKKK